uniref:Uncharacterized protein n=1 Tax=viral metagenome TaxID=1070528 RepID=A0A6M3XJ04_9ZZZZ
MTGEPRHERPQPDVQEAIGSNSPADRELRMRCLVEAREQARYDCTGFPDIIYRARLNARFVLEGTTPVITLKQPEPAPDIRSQVETAIEAKVGRPATPFSDEAR